MPLRLSLVLKALFSLFFPAKVGVSTRERTDVQVLSTSCLSSCLVHRLVCRTGVILLLFYMQPVVLTRSSVSDCSIIYNPRASTMHKLGHTRHLVF